MAWEPDQRLRVREDMTVGRGLVHSYRTYTTSWTCENGHVNVVTLKHPFQRSNGSWDGEFEGDEECPTCGHFQDDYQYDEVMDEFGAQLEKDGAACRKHCWTTTINDDYVGCVTCPFRVYYHADMTFAWYNQILSDMPNMSPSRLWSKWWDKGRPLLRSHYADFLIEPRIAAHSDNQYRESVDKRMRAEPIMPEAMRSARYPTVDTKPVIP